MNKTALITGASGGIGLELAKIFAKDNYNIILVARSENKLNELKAQLEKQYNIKAYVFAADLSLEDAAVNLYNRVLQSNIKIDVLVNNAGFGDYCEYVQSDLKKQQNMINVNVKALAELSHLFGAQMKKQGGGKIVNVASIAAMTAGPYMAVYYASKAFVLSFSQAIAYELKPYGVTVTAFCPGPTYTGFENAAAMSGVSTMFSKLKPSGAEQVAKACYKAMVKGKTVKCSNFAASAMTFASRFTPRAVNTSYAAWVNGKPASKK